MSTLACGLCVVVHRCVCGGSLPTGEGVCCPWQPAVSSKGRRGEQPEGTEAAKAPGLVQCAAG